MLSIRKTGGSDPALKETCFMRDWELPSAVTNGLDELLSLSIAAHEGDFDPELLQTRLLSARQSILWMEERAGLFSRRYPDEVELESAMDSALRQLKEALGAIFLCLTEDEEWTAMGEAAQLLSEGGGTAVACLKAMGSLAEAQRESPWSEAALSALNESQQTRLRGVRALERVFAPHSWREEYLKPMLDLLEEMERCRESLYERASRGGVTEEQFAGFHLLTVGFDELEKNARTHRPSLESLPDVGRFRELMMLLGAVYERRTPIGILKAELEELIAGTNEFVVPEALELLRHAVRHDDVTHFPVLWDRLCDQR